ncbi:MAG: thioredoxin TrxC [Gammaproteobacteria bacterium]
MNTPLQLVCPYCAQLNRLPRERVGDAARCGRCKRALLAAHPVALDDTAFARFVARNELPVVVDFWAAWCGPCKMMAPLFERAAAAFHGRALFAKVDTDAAPATAQAHDIRSIPTLVVFDRGRALARQSGALDATRLRAFVEQALAQAARGDA